MCVTRNQEVTMDKAGSGQLGTTGARAETAVVLSYCRALVLHNPN